MAKMSLEDLRKLRENTQQQIKKRDMEGKQIQIIVGMGTCGIAAGAKATLDAFVKELDAKGMGGDAIIRQTGCGQFLRAWHSRGPGNRSSPDAEQEGMPAINARI